MPVVALAEDEEDFESLVASLLNLYKFEVITVEDIELLRRRLEHGPLEKEIVELAKGLTPDDPIALSQFEAYESE